jgi:hypothetical protein
MSVMPRDISCHATVLSYYDESAGLIETHRTDRDALGPRTEIIKWTLAAGQQREIR